MTHFTRGAAETMGRGVMEVAAAAMTGALNGPGIPSFPDGARQREPRRHLVRGLAIGVLISAIMGLGAKAGSTADESGHGPDRATPQARASADKAMAARARDINRTSVGETRVASFLAAEFNLTEAAVVAEQRGLGASWGNLTIAHTLAASDKLGMTVAQVLQLHDHGMGWGQVAAGLGLNLRDAVKAVNAECRVARGRAKADGKAATIRGDVL